MAGTEYDSFLRDQFETQMRKHPVYPHQSNPKEWYPGQGGVASIFQDEVSSLDPTSVTGIKGAKVYQRGMREYMKAAIKDRGSADDVIGRVLRGTWWHGRKTPPKIGNKMITMESTRARGTKFGEPIGTSLTSSTDKASGFANHGDMGGMAAHKIEDKILSLVDNLQRAKGIAFEDHMYKSREVLRGDPNLGGAFYDIKYTDLPGFVFDPAIVAKHDKHTKALSKGLDRVMKRHLSPRIARVFPDFGGRPEDVIIDSTSKKGGAVMKEHYEQTLRQMARSGEYEGGKDYDGVPVPLSQAKDYIDLRRVGRENDTFISDFNTLLTSNLEKSGYRGVLYSPQERFGEFELKMFPGHGDQSKGSKWAIPVDVRKYESGAVQRFGQSKEKLNEQWVDFINEQRDAGNAPYKDLGSVYEEVDVRKTLKDFDKRGWLDHVKDRYSKLFDDESSLPLISNDPGFDDDFPF